MRNNNWGNNLQQKYNQGTYNPTQNYNQKFRSTNQGRNTRTTRTAGQAQPGNRRTGQGITSYGTGARGNRNQTYGNLANNRFAQPNAQNRYNTGFNSPQKNFGNRQPRATTAADFNRNKKFKPTNFNSPGRQNFKRGQNMYQSQTFGGNNFLNPGNNKKAGNKMFSSYAGGRNTLGGYGNRNTGIQNMKKSMGTFRNERNTLSFNELAKMKRSHGPLGGSRNTRSSALAMKGLVFNKNTKNASKSRKNVKKFNNFMKTKKQTTPGFTKAGGTPASNKVLAPGGHPMANVPKREFGQLPYSPVNYKLSPTTTQVYAQNDYADDEEQLTPAHGLQNLRDPKTGGLLPLHSLGGAPAQNHQIQQTKEKFDLAKNSSQNGNPQTPTIFKSSKNQPFVEKIIQRIYLHNLKGSVNTGPDAFGSAGGLISNYKVDYKDFGSYVEDCKKHMMMSKDLAETKKRENAKPPSFFNITLPKSKYGKKKRLLLLDLDETLVHSENFQEGVQYDFIVDFMDYSGKSLDSVGIFFRPYAEQFLKDVAEDYVVAIFTAQTQEYADAVCNQLDPEGVIQEKYYRQHCTPIRDFFVKDLDMFPNISKEDIFIIDNFIYSFALDLQNGIPIKPYYMGKDDFELEYMAKKLCEIRNIPSTAQGVNFIDKQFGLTEFYRYLAGGAIDFGIKPKKKVSKNPKTMRASVIIGKPQSPPSPSHSPNRRRRLQSGGKPKQTRKSGMFGNQGLSNRGYYNRNRNNSPVGGNTYGQNRFGQFGQNGLGGRTGAGGYQGQFGGGRYGYRQSGQFDFGQF